MTIPARLTRDATLSKSTFQIGICARDFERTAGDGENWAKGMDMLSIGKTQAAKLSLLFVMAAGLSAFSSAPIPAGTNTALYGNLTDGGKFGVTVGQSTANLQQVLWEQGYGYEGAVPCSSTTQRLFGCASSEQYLEFQPVNLDRKGHLFLKVKDNRVSQIGWELNVVASLDG